MLKKLFHQLLDAHTVWVDNSTDNRNVTDENGNISQPAAKSQPERGYEVVLAHRPRITICDWCSGTCSKEKTYRRSIGSNVWTAKCQDCGKTHKIPTREVVQRK